MAIAGGGSSAISTLTSTNNASSTFITANVLYDRYSFADYISSSFVTAARTSSLMIPSIFLEPNKNKNNKNNNGNIGNDDGNNNENMNMNMNNMSMTNDRNGLFGYCSPYSSLLLSYSSLKSTFMYSKPLTLPLPLPLSLPSTQISSSSNNNNDYNDYLGIGCTSALVSQSKEGRKSKIYITITNGFGDYTSYDFMLDNGMNGEGGERGERGERGEERKGGKGGDDKEISQEEKLVVDNTDVKLKRRNRQEEEDVVGALILWCTHHYLDNGNCDHNEATNSNSNSNINSNVNINAILQQILNRNGDTITIKARQQLSFGSEKGIHNENYSTKMIIDAANHVLQQQTSTTSTTTSRMTGTPSPRATAVVLAPNYRYGKVIPTAIQSVLPSNPIIFPGSFNPVHFGHIGLAKAAIKAMGRKAKMELSDYYQRCSSTSSDQSLLESLWNTTEYLSIKELLDYNSNGVNQGNSDNEDNYDDDDDDDEQLCQILFEMSLTNPDKPSMDPNEVARRIEFFNGMIHYHDDHNNKNNNIEQDKGNGQGIDTTSCTMPNNWGILLTSAPLFIDKVRLLREYLAPSAGTYDNTSLRRRLMTFVIGTDTMVRIINPKYYDNNVDKMLKAVREMGDLGAHFVVGGRLEQSKNNDKSSEKIFVTGKEELVDLPEDVRDMFTIIKEEDFRIDISSSEIRARTNHQM